MCFLTYSLEYKTDQTRPLYNAELAAPEIRGLLVALQQLTTTVGIMTAYWIGYGSNYIGGTGDSQSDMAWRLPLIIQGIPAVILAVGVWFMPFSPRLLVNKGREEEALKTLSRLRSLPEDGHLVQIEFLEIKSEAIFERNIFDKRFPNLSKQAGGNVWLRELAQYTNIFRTKDSFKRVAIASLVMFFQQWSGIDSSRFHHDVLFSYPKTSTNGYSYLLRHYHLPVTRS
jgi:MFS family permease